ncbi:MAG TPA: hypothetical protein VFG62_10355 [Rhodopila sp.]|jgi:hypothetical protein|nr:hypothetical protein [Rhodopila sp.]
MSPLRTIARWSAGPTIGIILGLVLGTVADKYPTQMQRHMTLSVPFAGIDATVGGNEVNHPHARPSGTMIAAAGD